LHARSYFTRMTARTSKQRVICVNSVYCVQWTNDTISNLLYNSEYYFDVEYESDRVKQTSHVTLTTPGCPVLIDDSFKRCSRVGPPLTGLACVSSFISFIL